MAPRGIITVGEWEPFHMTGRMTERSRTLSPMFPIGSQECSHESFDGLPSFVRSLAPRRPPYGVCGIQLSSRGPSKYDSGMFEKLCKDTQIQIELLGSHFYIMRAHTAA